MSIKSNSQAVNFPRRAIRMAQLREKIPFSESHLYALIQKQRFPKPFQIAGGRASFWYEEDIDDYLSSQRALADVGES
jgi:predicted DNA-binding transcriptional regulator AlpA